jgi:hypothetical protein
MKRHGLSSSPEYTCWRNIKARCLNQRHPAYADYGGRGIAVCPAWRDSFKVFLADVGSRPSAAHSLDRIDNDRGYEPENCRWVTIDVQARNKRPQRCGTERPERRPDPPFVRDPEFMRVAAEAVAGL